MNEDEPRYYWQDLDETNHQDLGASIYRGDLVGIVDTEDGGIIAYAIGVEHAKRIIEALKGAA